MARAEVHSGDVAAVEAYRKILQNNPYNVSALQELILLDIGPGKNLPEARSLAEQLTALQPDQADNWMYASLAYPKEDGQILRGPEALCRNGRLARDRTRLEAALRHGRAAGEIHTIALRPKANNAGNSNRTRGQAAGALHQS